MGSGVPRGGAFSPARSRKGARPTPNPWKIAIFIFFAAGWGGGAPRDPKAAPALEAPSRKFCHFQASKSPISLLFACHRAPRRHRSSPLHYIHTVADRTHETQD